VQNVDNATAAVSKTVKGLAHHI